MAAFTCKQTMYLRRCFDSMLKDKRLLHLTPSFYRQENKNSSNYDVVVVGAGKVCDMYVCGHVSFKERERERERERVRVRKRRS